MGLRRICLLVLSLALGREHLFHSRLWDSRERTMVSIRTIVRYLCLLGFFVQERGYIVTESNTLILSHVIVVSFNLAPKGFNPTAVPQGSRGAVNLFICIFRLLFRDAPDAQS